MKDKKTHLDYEHYDMVVKDLLSEIKIRKTQEKKSRQILSPTKNSDSKSRTLTKFQI